MNEIEYKLESKNPVLIAHTVSKLFETIRKNVTNENAQLSKVPQFQLLLSKKDSTDFVLSLTVAQALVALVENELWDVESALSTFISAVSAQKNYVATATAVGKLVLLDLKHTEEKQSLRTFTLHAPQHPFISLLSQNKDSWQALLYQMKFIFTHHNEEQSIEALRPVFLFILCNPCSDLPNNCRREAWLLLMKLKKGIDLQKEILLWSCANDKISCTHLNERLLDLAEISIADKNRKQCTALLAAFCSLTLELIKQGFDPQTNLDMMSLLLNYSDSSIGSLTLLLMSEILVVCPVIYLFNILKLCMVVTTKLTYSRLSANVLTACILNWLAYPSILCSDSLDLARSLMSKLSREDQTAKNQFSTEDELFSIFALADSSIRFYMEFQYHFSTWSEDDLIAWLNEISLASINIRDKCKLVLCGVLLENSNPEIGRITCNTLVEIAWEIKGFGAHVLPLILHKLTKSRSSEESKYLLQAIPEFISTKENVPIITHTLDTLLNGEKALRYFAIELYLKALDREPRCYRFLSTAIMRLMKQDHSWYADAACAKAMKYICENYPEHGEKLVPLLSEILSRCTDVNGCAASALALKSISALCKSAVIGVCSTWRVLTPRMEREKRTIVLESLCEFFAEVPSYPSKMDEEYDQLIVDVISNLWKYAISSDVRVAKAALKALASYRLEQIPLKTLPAEFRCNLVLPPSYAKTPIDAARSPEDVLPYIPSTCWIQLLQKINKALLPAVGDLLISYIEREVSGYRSGVYTWQEEPRDFKYLPDRSIIRTVGEYLRRSDKRNPDNEFIISECLRVFSHKYSKPLPNVNWSFLHDTSAVSAQANEYSLLIGCHHTPISLSARAFVESYLAKFKTPEDIQTIVDSREYLILYKGLEDVVQVIQPNNLKLFLETTLDYVLEKIRIQDGNAIRALDFIMAAYGKALKNSEIHDGNSTLLTSILEKLLDRIDLTNDQMSGYIGACLQLSMKDLERLTSPRVWWEIHPDRLKNAIAIRAELVEKRRTESPLTWLNECIEVTSTIPSVHSYLFSVLRRVQLFMQFERSSSTWILDLMSDIQGLVVDTSVQRDNSTLEFYCNVLFISIVCLSGMDCILAKKDALITSEDTRIRLFVHAVSVLANRQDWKSVTPQIMEWLHYMRTSSIADKYKSIFCTALLCLRHNPYYRDVWTKYLSVKTAVNMSIVSYV